VIPLFKVLMSSEAERAAVEVLRSGYVGQGPKVEEFEQKLKEYYRSDTDILTTNSCTSAINLALHLCDVRPGDSVLTTSMTCSASNSPIVTRGAYPVWCDVDQWTGLIDPDSVDEALCELLHGGEKVKAIIAVDWTGAKPDYSKLKKLGIPIIEDAAHCFSPFGDSRGDYVCNSYQAIKIETCVDGGSLKCPGEKITERARLLRWYGLDRRSSQSFRCNQNISVGNVGFKYHMNDLNAAIGIANIPVAIDALNKQRKNAEFYNEALKDLDRVCHVRLPSVPGQWLYMLLVDNREGFTGFMTARGIEVSPVHARNDKHDGFKRVASQPVSLKGLDYYSARNVAIPVGWWLTQENLEYISESVIQWSKTS